MEPFAISTDYGAPSELQQESYRQGFITTLSEVKTTTFDELATKGLAYCQGRSRSAFHEKTLVPLKRYFTGWPVSKITQSEVMEYQSHRRRGTSEEKKGVSGATVNRELAVLKRLFNLGKKWKFTTANPVEGVEFFPEHRQKFRFLSVEEIHEAEQKCDPELRECFVVAVSTGLRRRELLGLTRHQVDMVNNLLSPDRTKSGKVRHVPMSTAVRAILKKRMEENAEDRLFPYGEGWLRQRWAQVVKDAKLAKVRWHDLRHTFASHWVMSGQGLVALKEILGHADMKTTMIYAHLAPEFKQGAMRSFDQWLRGQTGGEIGTKLAQTGNRQDASGEAHMNCVELPTQKNDRAYSSAGRAVDS